MLLSGLGYGLWRKLLFGLAPEAAHRLTIRALRLAQASAPGRALLASGRRIEDPRLEQELLGVRFPGPVGLAAGFDKNGEVVPGMTALGFGFVEVGTVTPRPQPGNPKPRMFRHPEAASLRNALGFNNAGADALARRLAGPLSRRVPVGVNVGRNKTTPPEAAEDDYLALVERFAPRADYLVINVSSPNTPGLRDLQEATTVSRLLRRARRLTERPLLVKLSPDLDPEQAVELSEAAVESGAAGLVLTNTTTDYSRLPGVEPVGGLSGRVLRDLSFAHLAAVAPRLAGRALVVSVGGIDTAEEAYRRLRAGASLVQIYTGLVYRGPGLAAEIHRGLSRLLDRDGFATLAEAVGADLAESG
ncbi:MAG: quinone-dependent dihydroorotate dehydrogenase [Thermoanaerobaculia bacterium]|nr:quinone-dependent dihydroorotate dehydrogenase [Thermoanaerobaculia bacterium]